MKNKKDEFIGLYYSHIGEGYFIDALKKFSLGEGFGIEYIWCVFANYYQEWEEDYFGESGVAFYFEPPAVKSEETIILNNEEFYNYLKEAANKFITKNEKSKKEVENYLMKIKSYLIITNKFNKE
jgi:hypothetical protein